jgi:hypothetical protein
LNDTTVSDDSADTQVVEEETEPTKAVFTYSVASGQQAYVEIYIDDEENPSTATTLDGPSETSIDVTGTLRFVTAAPDAVTLTVDGETVEPTEISEGLGVYEYTVDFASILSEWKADHHTASSASSSASSSTGSSTSDTASDSTSA